MGIDRIAGHPIGVSLPETANAARLAPQARAFEAARPAPAPPPCRVDRASGALEELRGGRIGAGDYVEKKVDEATSHLGALPRDELDAIREVLRDRLANDPSLCGLVRAAVGEPARPPDD